MALIKCSKCGKEISDMSSACIHCGYKHKKRKYKWLIILICSLVGILFLSFIGLVTYIIIDSYKFAGTWTNITDYYDKNNPSKFICRVESILTIDDYDKITYKSEVVSGDCIYDNQYIRGDYEYDFNSIDVEFNYHSDYDYDTKVFYNDEYLCIDDCDIAKNRFYKDKNDSISKDYIETYYEPDYNEGTSDAQNFYSGFISITYDQYKEQIKKTDKFIIFAGSPTCYFCQQLKENINNIKKVYNLPEIYFLDIDTLNDLEHKELFDEINPEVTIPVLRVYNNGLKDSFVGLQSENTLIYSFTKNGLLNNNSL